VDNLIQTFRKEKPNTEVYFVELEADLQVRLKRNRHEHRLKHKPSKRDLKRSEEVFLHFEENYRFNTREGEFKRQNYLKIKNDNVTPKAAAKMIVEYFKV
jgi:hypothetical protein